MVSEFFKCKLASVWIPSVDDWNVVNANVAFGPISAASRRFFLFLLKGDQSNLSCPTKRLSRLSWEAQPSQ